MTHAGSVGTDNALDTLMQAARLLRHHPQIAFFIIGTGDLVDEYKSACADLPNVVFADPVASKYVQPILRRSSVLYFAAHPSVVLDYGQSLNKLIDYMYSGRPVIGSYSGFPSMINEADCGELVPAGDSGALASALRTWAQLSHAQLDSIGQRGRDWVLANRTFDGLTERYLALMFPVLGDGGFAPASRRE